MKYIGIDTGVKTGLAVWDNQSRTFDSIETTTITRAMEKIKAINAKSEVRLYIEDARQRKWFGNAGREKLQGAGSVKRDAKIWEDFCREQGIECRMIPPKNNATKLSADRFARYTGWKGRTSEHSRDAAMLVFGK